MTAINRRNAIKTGIAAASFPAIHLNATAANTKPNILMIMADQHRGDCLGCDGHPVVQTPNLDRLASEGVRFNKAYSCTPTCTPARAALLTGLGPWRNGMLGYSRVPERYPVEKPRVLGEAGYHTMVIGKNHFHPQRNSHGYHHMLLDESGRELDPEYRSDYRSWFWSKAPNLDPGATGIGWNDYRSKPYVLPEELHPTVWTGQCAVNFLNSYQQSSPFFLKVSFARPHSPYDAPQRFFDWYRDADIPKASVGAWAKRYAEGDPNNFNSWFGDFGEAQVRRSRQGYYGSVMFIDEQIGKILEALDKRGDLENTLIVYFSDHGDMTGDHNLWRKSYAYEASARIPFLMRVPDSIASVERGTVCDKTVEIRDLLPTFMDAAGIGGAGKLEGKSLLPLAQGNAEGWRDYIDLEHDVCYSKANHWSALTDGHQKYIFHCRDGEEQLFDLDNDPGELYDLASSSKHAADVSKWRNRLIEHLSERGDRFVKNGKLALRPESILKSPNYPVAER